MKNVFWTHVDQLAGRIVHLLNDVNQKFNKNVFYLFLHQSWITLTS